MHRVRPDTPSWGPGPDTPLAGAEGPPRPVFWSAHSSVYTTAPVPTTFRRAVPTVRGLASFRDSQSAGSPVPIDLLRDPRHSPCPDSTSQLPRQGRRRFVCLLRRDLPAPSPEGNPKDRGFSTPFLISPSLKFRQRSSVVVFYFYCFIIY